MHDLNGIREWEAIALLWQDDAAQTDLSEQSEIYMLQRMWLAQFCSEHGMVEDYHEAIDAMRAARNANG